ncbi:MAG: tripartite tricarboxylate transporter substrate binding protein [Betaproteobacteria bacterium]|nr:tripartite tricarboxylate transporter substrate binding protein [Betaproteobacteria bacterium]
MQRSRFIVWMFTVGLMVPGASVVSGQTYPNKPIRIVAGAPGGGGDLVARLLAPGLSNNLGQQVIVENRGGAGGVIAAQTVVKASPDGYTMLLYGNGIWLLPFMNDNLPYDPVRDFAPITLATTSPNILVVHPSLPVKSVKELIVYAKGKPGELNYASSGIGASDHLAAELFRSMAGVDIVRINHKGTAAALTDLIGGSVQLMFPSAGSVAPHIKSGRLRAVAVTTAQPSALVPGLPTVAASGLPGYERVQVLGILAPAKTPAAIISRLNQEIVRILNNADVQKRFFSAGVETIGNSPQEFAATIKSDMAVMGKVIRDAGINAK